MSTKEPNELTQDTVYDLLSNKRRRYVISKLRRADGAVSVNELSEAVAAWENDVDVDELTDKQVKRVYVSLYQIHVPKLDEAGLVDYDKEAGTVELTPTVSQLDSYLPEQERETTEVPWPLVYGAVAAVALSLYAGVFLLPGAFEWLPLTALNVVVFTALAVVALAHYVTEQWR
jgi:hypothetical protein